MTRSSDSCPCDHAPFHGPCRAHGELDYVDPRTSTMRCNCPRPDSPGDTTFSADPLAMHRVLLDVQVERTAQDARWGEQNHPDGTGLYEYQRNAADAARAACQQAAATGKVTWRHILMEEVLEAFAEDHPATLREELVQIAAVAVAWAQAIDRRDGAR